MLQSLCFRSSTVMNVALAMTKRDVFGKMYSWCISKFGGPEQLTLVFKDADLPLPGPNEVLVKTLAHSINPIDVAMLGGYGHRILSRFRGFPIILGRDFVGEVLKNGNNVSKVNVGDLVWGIGDPKKPGTFSTHLIVSKDNITKKPKNLDILNAACVPCVGLTVWSVLWSPSYEKDKPKVLVLGGSGGVGSIAVQMLKAWGCRVVTTCSTDAVPQLEALELHKVIDYKSIDYNQKVDTNGPYDLIFNASGTQGTPHQENLKKWSLSKYVTITHPVMRNADNFGLILGMLKSMVELVSINIYTLLTKGAFVTWGVIKASTKGLESLAQLAEEGKIQPQTYKIFKFSQLPSAFECQQEGHVRGKIVLEMDDHFDKIE